MSALLDFVGLLLRHVVAQVVETHLVVGGVGDIGLIAPTFLRRSVAKPWDDETDFETQPTMNLAHPLGVTPCQVVVDRHEMYAIAGQPVQIRGKGRDEGLALSRFHLGDPTEVHCGPTHHLHVIVALADDPHGGLACNCKRL